MNLCNEMATRTSASRVSIGWVKNERVRVKALSHTEEFDKRQELIVQLERAMEECYDQEEVVQYEPDGTSSNNVTREAQAISRAQGGNTVLSIPLRRQSEIQGVLTLEFAPGQQLGPQAATGLSVAADLLAPQLYDRFQNDRWLITKAGISTREVARLPKPITVVSVEAKSAGQTWIAPSSAACAGEAPRSRRSRMLSSTMVAASSVMPTAKAMPAIEITFSVWPVTSMTIRSGGYFSISSTGMMFLVPWAPS